MWLDFKTVAGFMTMAEAEPYGHDDGPPAHELVADEIRALHAQVRQDDGWAPRRVAEAIGRPRDDKTFKAALAQLIGSGEWEATGSTSDRTVRPAALGSSGTRIGSEPKYPKGESAPSSAASPANTEDSGDAGGLGSSDSAGWDYPKSAAEDALAERLLAEFGEGE